MKKLHYRISFIAVLFSFFTNAYSRNNTTTVTPIEYTSASFWWDNIFASSTYSSTIKQADANRQVVRNVNANGIFGSETYSTCILAPNDRVNSIPFNFSIENNSAIKLSILLISGNNSRLTYSLTGPANRSGVLCISGPSGPLCSGESSDIVFNNMPGGNYNLTVTAANADPVYRAIKCYWTKP